MSRVFTAVCTASILCVPLLGAATLGGAQEGEWALRVCVIDTDGREVVEDGELWIDVEDMERTIVTSYGERRKIVFGNRRILGHEIELPIAQPGRYRVVVSCCWEEASPGTLLEKDWPDLKVGDFGFDAKGQYVITKADYTPKFEDPTGEGTGVVVPGAGRWEITKTHRYAFRDVTVTHVDNSEKSNNPDRVLVVLPVHELRGWIAEAAKIVAADVISNGLAHISPGTTIESILTHDAPANLLVTAGSDLSDLVTDDTAVELVKGAAVKLAFGQWSVPVELTLMTFTLGVEGGAIEFSRRLEPYRRSDDYEYSVEGTIDWSHYRETSVDGSGDVVIQNLGPPMQNVQVRAVGMSINGTEFTVKEPISRVYSSIDTNSIVRVAWDIDHEKMVRAGVFRFVGIRLVYETRPGVVAPLLVKSSDVLDPRNGSANPPVVEMQVVADTYVVRKGTPISFHGTLLTTDGVPVIEALLGVEDPVAQTTQVLEVDASGRFSYTSSTDFLTKPGGYAFIFRCSETRERVLTVALLDPSANSVDLASIGMPIGDQGTIEESFLAKPKGFTTVTRTTTGMSPPTGTTLPGPPTPPSPSESLRLQAAAVAQEAVQASLRKSGSSSTSRAEVVAALTGTSRSSSTATGVSSGATAYLDTIAIDDAEAVAKSAISRSALAVDQREALIAGMDRSTMFYSVVRLDPFLGVVTADTAASQRPEFGSGEVRMVVQSDPNVGPQTPPEFLATIALDDGGVLAIAATGIAEESPPTAHGLLDVVIAIDKSGSMADDIECVQRGVDTILGEMAALAQQQNISLQVGLVLFSYTGEGNVFETCPLSVDIEAARQFVAGLNPQEVGGDEDLYSALMYAMNEPVEGQQIDMGWRTGAAKIAIPITDEAPKSDNFNVLQVAQVAEDLDPVHMYPLIMPQGPLTWLDSTESSLKELARVTGGEAVKVQDAEALPRAIVDAVALAIRRHKEEIYRQENPPYLLYGVAGGMGGVLLLFVAGLLFLRRRRVELHNVPSALPIDSDLTGDTAFRRTDG